MNSLLRTVPITGVATPLIVATFMTQRTYANDAALGLVYSSSTNVTSSHAVCSGTGAGTAVGGGEVPLVETDDGLANYMQAGDVAEHRVQLRLEPKITIRSLAVRSFRGSHRVQIDNHLGAP